MMNGKKHLSVIVPIYNVEKYLSRCIDSIIRQSFTNFEIILVDDGSTDRCGRICDEYSKIDKRIIVIHKKNGGLSDARNIGIYVAQGKYISFIDSDDFIIDVAYEKLIIEAEIYDLDIVTGYAMTYLGENIYYPKMKKRNFPNRVYCGIDFLSMSIKDNCMSMCAPLNLYKSELIKDNNLYFKLVLHEDELWTPQVFLKANRVKYIDIDFYMYYKRVGSITQTNNKTPSSIDCINSCYELERIYLKIGNIQQRKLLNDYLLMFYLNAFFEGKLIGKEYNQLIKKTFVLRKANNFKNTLKALLFFINKQLYFHVNLIYKLFKRK